MPFEIVALIGRGLGQHYQAIKALSEKYPGKILIIGNGSDDINPGLSSSIDSDSIDINAIYITSGHGRNIKQDNKSGKKPRLVHHTDKIPTAQIANNLKRKVKRDITMVSFGCEVGGTLKFELEHGDLDDGITLLTRSGSTESSPVHQNGKSISKLISLKLDHGGKSLSNPEIFADLVSSDIENFRYLHKDPKGQKQVQVFYGIKVFSLDQIKKIFQEYQQSKKIDESVYLNLISKFEETGKKNFSKENIITLLEKEAPNFVEAIEKSMKHRWSNPEEFLSQRNLSVFSLKKNLEEKKSSGKSFDDVLFDCLLAAVANKKVKDMQEIIEANPNLASKHDESGCTILLTIIMLKFSADIIESFVTPENINKEHLKFPGMTPLIRALKDNQHDTVKMLLKNNANILQKYNGKFPLELAKDDKMANILAEYISPEVLGHAKEIMSEPDYLEFYLALFIKKVKDDKTIEALEMMEREPSLAKVIHNKDKDNKSAADYAIKNDNKIIIAKLLEIMEGSKQQIEKESGENKDTEVKKSKKARVEKPKGVKIKSSKKESISTERDS